MSQDAPTPAGPENLSTDLRGLTGRSRRYKYIEGYGHRLRLQSFNAEEFLAIREFPAALQTDIGISYAIVDEHGDCTHTHDPEGVAYFKDLDAEIYLWLVNEVNAHCLGEKKD